MNWTELTEESQLEDIRELSKSQPVVIFKHSIRCSISSMALGRLQRATAPAAVVFFHLDLIRHRNISNKISELFDVPHQSPQILLIRDGECIYDESHSGISMDEIAEQLGHS